MDTEFSNEKLLETREKEGQIATELFNQNKMTTNLDIFQAIVVKRNSNEAEILILS